VLISNLKTLTLIVARHRLPRSNLFGLSGAVAELQGLLWRPTSGVRDLRDNPAGEFHELGGLANDYQCTPGFTTTERDAIRICRQQ
jgi:hypothetical protein